METTASVLAATPLQGIVFGLLTLPICLWVAYTDLSTMKIRNEAVIAMFVVFVVAGFFVITPATDYLWRFAHLAVILAIGFVLSMIGAVGAGDAKFAAAMAPFVALADWQAVLVIFCVLLIVTWVLHRLARMIPAVRNLAPNWQSWTEKKDFPMGVTLAATQLTYLGLAATG
ncbi:prepilin peptidase [Jannaschia sp. M317]|uniref:prepilin peptidase n=1 Tax=Jannaschia sp. M317 TaxID=2867011 RepID=UPI0021A75C32|nr:prepilin peptidase [Jannaschia sp. M317]UWQ17538.1 prepilin peptidase [Jannaschia sp. M317]